MAGESLIASVVVPAHNEEAVLGRTLDVLLADALPGEFDVVVVANACTDRTADRARREGVRVVSTEIGGKAHALTLGDAECSTFPRIYLDADVSLGTDDARLLVKALEQPGVLACAPVPQWDVDGASGVARRVHKVHDALVSPVRGLAGVGVYALSEAGHARAFPLPDVLSDDEWVHRSFDADERAVVAGARSIVRPARTVSAHLSRRVRVRLGNRQLTELGRPAAHGRLRLRSVTSLVRSSRISVLDAACYLGVLSADRMMARLRRPGVVTWSTDRSSR